MIMQRSNLYRVLAALAGIFGALLLAGGQQIFIFSSVMLLAYLLVDIRRSMLYLQLDTVWVVAFLAVICGEGIFDAQIITVSVTAGYYDAAATYINVINFCFLAFFNLIQRHWPEQANTIQRVSQTNKYYWLILLGICGAYLAISITGALQILIQGRFAVLATEDSVRGSADLIRGVVRNSGIILPPIIAYHMLFQKNYGRGQGLMLTVLACAPIILIQVALGVRSPLIISLIGVLTIYISRYPFGVARPLKLIGGAAIVLLATTLMKNLRGAGLQSDFANNNINLGNGQHSFLSEGVVEYFAKMVSYFDLIGFRNGLEHVAISLFWVPRSLWADKPTQLEYWFPRAYGDSGFSEAHSIAATFAATAYADFGFVGACLLWTIIGFAFGIFNRWCTRVMYIERGSASIVIVAVAMGMTFFAVRQFGTIVFLAASVFIFWQLYKLSFVQEQRREAPTAAPQAAD